MNNSDLIGTWKLVRNRHWGEDGADLPAQFGPEPMGLIHFKPNGRMMVVIADSRVTLPSDSEHRLFSGYTGRWVLEGAKLSTIIDESFLPYVGTVQIRDVEFSGGQLNLIPPPMVIDGVTHYRELVWEKVV